MPSWPTLHDSKGRHSGRRFRNSDTDKDKTTPIRKGRDFLLIKCVPTVQVGVLPIKSLLRLEETTPKAGGGRINLPPCGPWFPLDCHCSLVLTRRSKNEGWDWNHNCPSKLEVCCKLQCEIGLHQDAVDENTITQQLWPANPFLPCFSLRNAPAMV